MTHSGNKVVLIIEGRSDICLTTVQSLIEKKAQVILVGSDAAILQETASILNSNTTSIVEDIYDIEQVLEKIEAEHGPINVLFANAENEDCIYEVESDEIFFERILNLNIKEVFCLFTKAFDLFLCVNCCFFEHIISKPGITNKSRILGKNIHLS